MLWFRMYGDAVYDPKVQSLPGELYKAWVNLLQFACKHDGKLPDLKHMAFVLHRKPASLKVDVDKLTKLGLIDLVDGHLQPHNWEGRQYKSDTSRDRVRAHRERKRGVTVTVTPPENRVRDRPSISGREDGANTLLDEVSQDGREGIHSLAHERVRRGR
jgi:hypothetical protein